MLYLVQDVITEKLEKMRFSQGEMIIVGKPRQYIGGEMNHDRSSSVAIIVTSGEFFIHN